MVESSELTEVTIVVKYSKEQWLQAELNPPFTKKNCAVKCLFQAIII